MAMQNELIGNTQDIVRQVSLNAPPEVRCIVFLFNNDQQGAAVMCANVQKERVRQILKDYLKKGEDKGQIVGLNGEKLS